MNEFLLYLTKSACWLTGFTLVYTLFLRNERYFRLKRAFLLFGIIVSIIFPLIKIHYQVELTAPQDATFLLPRENLTALTGEQQDNAGAFDNTLILLFIYLAGMIFLGIRIIWQTLKLYKTINSDKKVTRESAIVVRSSAYPQAFSFINYVFINPSMNENEAAEILNHELVHVKQKHWLDLMMAEILRLLQWANPFAWVYTSFIRLNHEYLADEVALQHSSNPALYRAALINQLFESPVISLSNSFSHSLNRKRFEMMKKINTSPYRKLKILLVLPVFAIIFYAFAVPSYRYTQTNSVSDYGRNFTQAIIDTNQNHPLIIIDGKETTLGSTDGIDPASVEAMGILKDESALKVFGEKGRNGVILITTKKSYVTPVSSDEQDKTIREVKGTVSREDGSPLLNAAILVTGTQARSSSDESGSFTLSDVPTVSRIIISARGYLTQLLKPEARLAVKMLKDPDYKESGITAVFNNYLVVLNGSISDRPYSYLSNIIQPDQIASISVIRGDDAAKKYGEKARTGAVVIITKDKAKEMGISVPFRRSKPEDFPTFKGNSHKSFTQWILEQLKYPAEAEQKGIQGRVSVSFVIEADGSVSNVKGSGDPLLTQVVADLVNSSPKWEPAANPEARQPFNTTVNLKFQLPDQITPDDVFVVTEQMPMYPGGDAALLDQIRNTTKYPQDALDQKIEGRVIVRFVVTAKGAVESATVLKGVHPSLDAEALRVVSSLGRFMPGSQGGKPVNVWYMVPVTFTLPGKEPNFSQSTTGDAPSDTVDQQPEYPGGEREMFRFIAENTVYPEEAKNLKIQGKVIVRCAVKKDGTVDRISVLKGVDPLLDNEAVRVVSLLKGFRPGMKNGAAVDSWLMIPLTFTVK